MVDIFMCHTSHPTFPAGESLSRGQLTKGWRNYHSQSTFENKKLLIETKMASNLLCMHNRICQRYETEPTPREANNEEQIDLEPQQLTVITQKQRNVPQARGDSVRNVTENRETLIRRASEQASLVRIVENEQFYITKESVMDGSTSAPVRWEKTGPRNSQHLRLQAFLNDHVKIGPVTGIEDSKSAGTLVIQVHILKKHARQFIPEDPEHQHSGAVLSPQTVRCGGDREHKEQVDIRQSDIKLRQSQSPDQLVSVNEFGNQSTKRDSEFVSISPSTSRRSYDVQVVMNPRTSTTGSCFDKHAKCWAKLRIGTKENWIHALSRSTDKPRIKNCEAQNGTMFYIRASQGHSHGVTINPTLFWKRYRCDGKNTYSKRIFLPTVNQSSRMLHRQED